MKTYTKLFSLMFLMFLSEQIFGQIQFYDYSPDTVITVYENNSFDEAYFFVDINGDSIDDIRFRLYYQYNFVSPHSTANFFVTVSSINGNFKFGERDPNYFCFIKGFIAGDTIDDRIGWDPMYSFLLFATNFDYCNDFETDRYLAFKHTMNGNSLYGWILLKANTWYGQPDATASVRLIVKEFAYNNNSKHGIIAGDTINSIYPTSIDNPSLNGNPKLYPNPTSGKFFIKNTEHKKIEILNIMGVVISETSDNEIDIGDYPNGLYFARFYYGGKLITRKIIKN